MPLSHHITIIFFIRLGLVEPLAPFAPPSASLMSFVIYTPDIHIHNNSHRNVLCSFVICGMCAPPPPLSHIAFLLPEDILSNFEKIYNTPLDMMVWRYISNTYTHNDAAAWICCVHCVPEKMNYRFRFDRHPICAAGIEC